jgi:hypothetical protein
VEIFGHRNYKPLKKSFKLNAADNRLLNGSQGSLLSVYDVNYTDAVKDPLASCYIYRNDSSGFIATVLMNTYLHIGR